MATWEHPSYRIAYPNLQAPGLRIDRQSAVLPAKPHKQLSADFSIQRKEVGDIFYFVAPRPRNPWASAGALGLQLLLLAALVIIPLYRTDPLPKMQTVTMLFAPPAAAAAASAPRLRVPVPTPISPRTSTSFPAPAQKTQEVPTQVAAASGVVGGVPGGVVGSFASGALRDMLGSTPSVPVVTKAPEPAPAKRMRVAARVAEANLVHDVAPIYPPEAGRERIEGSVVLLAVIGKDGTVQDVRVESGLPVLAQAAINAVKQWRYKPYLIDGEPVEIDSRITINFTLSRG